MRTPRTSNKHGWTLAFAAALVVGLAAPTQAQDTTRTRDTTTTRRATSQQRIPVQKRVSGGEVALPRRTPAELRADSIARADSLARAEQMRIEQMRRDSVAAAERARADSVAAVERARTDSINAVERARADSLAAIERARTDSMARADSIARAEQLRMEQMKSGTLFGGSGFYMGVAAGSTMPTGNLRDLGYSRGFNVNVPIGWHKPGNLLGLRLDLGYNHLDGNDLSFTPTPGGTPVTLNNPDPKIYSATLNATMKFPFNEARTTGLYLLGGGGVYMFRDLGTSGLGGYIGNDVLDPDDETNETSVSKWGVNAGAGLEFGVGTASLFLETRFVNAFVERGTNPSFGNFLTSSSSDLRWVPIVLGVSIR
jgi:hypothetical protein